MVTRQLNAHRKSSAVVKRAVKDIDREEVVTADFNKNLDSRIAIVVTVLFAF